MSEKRESIDLPSDILLSVDKFVRRKLIPTGVIASILGAVLGYGVNEAARSGAYATALADYSPVITELASEIGEAKGKAENASEAVRATKVRADSLLAEITSNHKESAIILNNTATVQKVLEYIESNDVLRRAIDTYVADLRMNMAQTNATLAVVSYWLLETYKSAATHGIHKGADEEVHLDWQRDHMKGFSKLRDELNAIGD